MDQQVLSPGKTVLTTQHPADYYLKTYHNTCYSCSTTTCMYQAAAPDSSHHVEEETLENKTHSHFHAVFEQLPLSHSKMPFLVYEMDIYQKAFWAGDLSQRSFWFDACKRKTEVEVIWNYSPNFWIITHQSICLGCKTSDVHFKMYVSPSGLVTAGHRRALLQC